MYIRNAGRPILPPPPIALPIAMHFSLNNGPWRRIDFLLVPWDEMGAALIYFTGNDIFNRSIRLLASRKGMRLNQRGLYKDVMRGKGREKITEGELLESKSEKRIFVDFIPNSSHSSRRIALCFLNLASFSSRRFTRFLLVFIGLLLIFPDFPWSTSVDFFFPVRVVFF